MQIGVINILKSLVSRYREDMLSMMKTWFLLHRKIVVLDLAIDILEVKREQIGTKSKECVIDVLEQIKQDKDYKNKDPSSAIDYAINFIKDI